MGTDRNGSDQRVFRFNGTFDFDHTQASQFAALVRFSRWDPTVLDVDLTWGGDESGRRASATALRSLGRSRLWLRATDPRERSCELLGINRMECGDRTASIQVAAIEMGIAQVAHSADARYAVIARLQPSGILCFPGIHRQDSSGAVQIEKIVDGVVDVDSSVGTLEAREAYEYGEAREHGDRITQHVQRASIMGEVTISKGQSLCEVHEVLKQEIDDTCIALSLCYRQPVGCYEIAYFGNDGAGLGTEALHRRRWLSSREKHRGDELINVRDLADGGLQRLLRAIRSSPKAREIRRAIQFLAASYEAGLETAYFMAFAAMETVINSCVDDKALDVVSPQEWKRVEQRLRAVLDELQKELSVPLDGLTKRLPELKRVALRARIEAACSHLRPKTEDLWPESKFLEGIAGAARIRSRLFHAAHPSDDASMYADLVRIRTFAERLLLKLLAWPDEKIWRWYDQDLKWINQG